MLGLSAGAGHVDNKNIQAFVVQDLDYWSNSLLPELGCWYTSKRAITKKERAIIAFCSVMLVCCYSIEARRHTIARLHES